VTGLTITDPAFLAAAASVFDPLSLSPSIWLDAADTATITQSLGKVSQWNDKSGNGRNVTQATSAAQPGTGAVTQNGKNVLTFDGNDLMQAATASTWNVLHDGTDYIIAAAVQYGTSLNPNALYVLCATYSSDNAFRGTWTGYDDRSTASRDNQIRHSVSNGTATPPVLNSSSNGAVTPNTFTVHTVLANPDAATVSTRSSLFVNSGSAIANNSSTGTPSASNAQDPLTIGFLPNGAIGYLIGRIGEIIIVSGANATEANRVALRNYLNTKWAVY
jgi:hypothetical protein